MPGRESVLSGFARGPLSMPGCAPARSIPSTAACSPPSLPSDFARGAGLPGPLDHRAFAPPGDARGRDPRLGTPSLMRGDEELDEAHTLLVIPGPRKRSPNPEPQDGQEGADAARFVLSRTECRFRLDSRSHGMTWRTSDRSSGNLRLIPTVVGTTFGSVLEFSSSLWLGIDNSRWLNGPMRQHLWPLVCRSLRRVAGAAPRRAGDHGVGRPVEGGAGFPSRSPWANRARM